MAFLTHLNLDTLRTYLSFYPSKSAENGRPGGVPWPRRACRRNWQAADCPADLPNVTATVSKLSEEAHTLNSLASRGLGLGIALVIIQLELVLLIVHRFEDNALFKVLYLLVVREILD